MQFWNLEKASFKKIILLILNDSLVILDHDIFSSLLAIVYKEQSVSKSVSDFLDNTIDRNNPFKKKSTDIPQKGLISNRFKIDIRSNQKQLIFFTFNTSQHQNCLIGLALNYFTF